MKIAIYSPYLDTASGGEKYMLTIAEVLAKGNQVDVLLDTHLSRMKAELLKQRNEERHGLDLSNVNFVEAPLGAGSSVSERFKFLKQYDWLFVNSDGSLFYSSAKNSVLHFQLPLSQIASSGVGGWVKLKSWKLAIYNSEFTKGYIDQLIKIKGQVVYPPVSVEEFVPLKKDKKILNVGRFALYGNPKKQDLMIEVFRELVKDGLKDWSLHLAGGIMDGNEKLLDDLKDLAKGLPVYFYPNIGLGDLEKLYGQSTIYWHAMGFGETDPKKFEHFGISTVEAMAAGCVPIVINKGGQTEIVEEGVSGLLWDSVEQWKEHTLKVIENQELRQDLALGAQARAKNFSKLQFAKQILELVDA